MKPQVEELIARIHQLEGEIEDVYRQKRAEMAEKKLLLADEFLRHQRIYKIGLIRFLISSRILVLISAPIIYAVWLPFLWLDLCVTIYQTICFPIYGIPKVRRSDYLVFDRGMLPYLNLIERFNCFYCSYGNGIAAYTREVAARTEQYWCPIKHARRLQASHARYHDFFEHGDMEAYRQGLERLRRRLRRETREGSPASTPEE